MNIIGIIPARGGSKGIPSKNIKLLGEKPLIAYTIESALESNFLSKVILNSEDENILREGQKYPIENYRRPFQLAQDDTTSIAVIKEQLHNLLQEGENIDAICLLQPTTPFRRKSLIDDAITKFKDGNNDSLISVREIPHEYNPYWAFSDLDGTLELTVEREQIVSRRQDLPKTYHRDGAIYITKTEVILNDNSFFGEKTGFIDTTKDPHVNLDTMKDWEKAENMIKSLN
ncbi:MAG: acylneuraminate cytidylyltransferase [Zunongwangia sp.]|uniref:acylneuraminate cytidylyltransferase family protein n=1 Tax=Zunongwangia profunda TaxID=398743 RepID=UPI000C92FC56|nr:acylneuraminate cytidylyltransferase family protein [Zunongwangia profunda]MAG89030.1 acylneuraminate cytidylyltransferase [Flavobacteriaceae bacterium]MAO35679.1 acylneuraminate cytidylyltransferase [Zunongwangia sp.]MCC4230176.1 acylneuraminate cytidylyltransferase family protein [Zunongwangia profunda]